MNPRVCRNLPVAGMMAAMLIVLPFQLAAEQVFPDPEGDLIGLVLDGPDATSLIATDLGDALLLEVDLADPDLAADLTGLIEVDTGAGQPGASSRLSLLCPKPTGLRVNRTLDLFARDGATVPVRDSDNRPVGTALWEQTSTGIALTLGKDLIGLETGLIELAAIIGTQAEASDCVPDGGEFTRAVIDLHRVIVQASAGAGGTIAPAGSIVSDLDQSVTFDLTPDAGHHIASVGGSCGGVLDEDIRSFATEPVTTGCNVEAVFAINTYEIGGTVSGLSGSGLTLALDNRELLQIDDNGAFAFNTLLEHGTAWSVSVVSQPEEPGQTCTVSNGASEETTDDVDDIEITCTTDQFSIGGTVHGLEGSGLVLQNYGGDDLLIGGNGAFVFPTLLNDGADYNVAVATQPAGPIQTCDVTDGNGIVAGANVSNVKVQCATEPPAITFSTADLDFGSLFGRDQATRVVTLINTGAGDLDLEQVSGPELPFVVTGGSCIPVPVRLASGTSCDLEVTFVADGHPAGEYESEIRIVSNAASSPDYIIVSGSVMAPVPVPMLGPFGLLALALFLVGLAGWRRS